MLQKQNILAGYGVSDIIGRQGISIVNKKLTIYNKSPHI